MNPNGSLNITSLINSIPASEYGGDLQKSNYTNSAKYSQFHNVLESLKGFRTTIK